MHGATHPGPTSSLGPHPLVDLLWVTWRGMLAKRGRRPSVQGSEIVLRSSAVRRRPLAAALVVTLGLAVSLVACGDDDDDASSGDGAARSSTSDTSSTSSDAPTTTGDPADVLASAGDAPAARGAGLAEPPGPTDRELFGEFGEVAIAITAPDGTVTGWCLLLAENDTQRARGLMEVTDFQGFPGMLFVWEFDSESSFYMRNTPTPLSIAWVAADGQLVSTEDMAPCEDVDGCPLYSARGPYRFALEVPQGELEGMGMVEGATMAVGGSCAPASDSS
jgi:uncharacterized membrane protein (UPF0127 family)